MRKLLPVVFSGFMAVSFSQLAAAQSVGVQGPAGTGANVDLEKKGTTLPEVQNNQQLGQGNQSNQQQGSDNRAQNNQQRGAQGQDSQQAGSSTSSKEQNSSTGSSSAGASGSDRMNPDAKAKAKDKKWDEQSSRPSGDREQAGSSKNSQEPSSSAGASSDSKKEDKKY
jgi:hypothetical protein